jgi:hypothetical protein
MKLLHRISSTVQYPNRHNIANNYHIECTCGLGS